MEVFFKLGWSYTYNVLLHSSRIAFANAEAVTRSIDRRHYLPMFATAQVLWRETCGAFL